MASPKERNRRAATGRHRRKILLGESPAPAPDAESFDTDAFDVDAFDTDAFDMTVTP